MHWNFGHKLGNNFRLIINSRASRRSDDKMRVYRKAALMEALTARRDEEDEEEEDVATEENYTCKFARLDKDLVQKFLQLDRDDETNVFIENCRQWSGSSGALWKDFFSCFLRSCCSLTTTNALLRIGSMHVLSSQHIRTLLGERTFACYLYLFINIIKFLYKSCIYDCRLQTPKDACSTSAQVMGTPWSLKLVRR
jgi:hypothetical protein